MNTSNVRKFCMEVLEAGIEKYDMTVGIVSRIQDGNYEVFAVFSKTGIPQTGDTYELNAVYCREVFEKKTTIAITEIDGCKGMCLHPLYKDIPCEAYLSSPIVVEGQTWGTLNYTCFGLRDDSFTQDDIAWNEAQAARIAQKIMSA